jgi:hypothetical protein
MLLSELLAVPGKVPEHSETDASVCILSTYFEFSS